MNSSIFMKWFNECYVPQVEIALRQQDLPLVSVLFVDNFSGHSTMVSSSDWRHVVLFLPPRTTSLIQPLDQEIIANLKNSYRKIIDDDLISKKGEHDLTKNQLMDRIKPDYVVTTLNKAYDNLSDGAIHHGWKNLLEKYLQDSSIELCSDVTEADKHAEKEVRYLIFY